MREQRGPGEIFPVTDGSAGYAGLSEAMRYFREKLTVNPFLHEVPVIVSGVRFAVHEGQFWLRDRDWRFVALGAGESARLKGLAVTGGREFTGFFMAGERVWRALSLWIDDKYYTLNNEHNG